MLSLRKISIEGFKSIESTEISLNHLNVVIGANGSGKSNLIGAFRLLERVLSKNLQLYIASEPDRILYHGRKKTPALALDFTFGQNSYGFKLKAVQDSMIFEYEKVEYDGRWYWGEPIAAGHKESVLQEIAPSYHNKIPQYVLPKIKNIEIYHFHDTSDASPTKQTCDISDNQSLRPDAANLAAYLYFLKSKHPIQFRHIEEHIRIVAPFFEQFTLVPSRLNENKIKLEWKQKDSDAYFDAYSLSDGTLRFICLATLLLQPNPPALILLDEPELGLHPFAIRILAEMLQSAAERAQVLLATQSVTLLDNFEPKDIIVAENVDGKTTFHRLDSEKLDVWLQEFSIGDLWEKNVLGGRP
jgi:predicted ATPase